MYAFTHTDRHTHMHACNALHANIHTYIHTCRMFVFVFCCHLSFLSNVTCHVMQLPL